MPKDRVTDVEDSSDRAAGFKISRARVDRDDTVAVYETAAEAIGRARDRNGPTLLGLQLHRQMGHFMSDPQTYRPDEDEEAALTRDSIDRLELRLHDHGVNDEALAEIRDEAEARVEHAISWAK